MPLFFDAVLYGDTCPVDWPMIVVGWRGFSSRNLSAEQVIGLAVEQIGKGTEEQGEIAAFLANVDPKEWQTIDRYLDMIFETKGMDFDRELALRRWRLAELKQILRQVYPLSEGEDEQYSSFYPFVDFWRAYDELPDSAEMIPRFGIPIEEMLRQQQSWANQEEKQVTRGATEKL